MDKKKVTILGCGAWGTTLAIILNKKGLEVKLWAHSEKFANEINYKRENAYYLPGFKIPKDIKVYSDLKKITGDSDLIIFAVASKFLKIVLKELVKASFKDRVLFLSAVKGLDEETFLRPSETIRSFLPKNYTSFLGVLSGPNLAKEIALGLPAVSVIASEEISIAEEIRSYLMSENFRIYTNTDVIGVELGGALKNVIAIASGIVEGLKLGDNAKAGLLVRGVAEIVRLGKKMGAKAETFLGLSGVGDLMTTCYSILSRNHQVGLELARGKSVETILKKMTAVAEGIYTTKAAKALAEKYEVEMPITEKVYEVLFENKKPEKAVRELMLRAPKYEIY